VAAQVGADERTERDELEPAGAEVGQGAGDQPLAQPLALEARVDLGVDEQAVPGSARYWMNPARVVPSQSS
jgi:hypothetical protein